MSLATEATDSKYDKTQTVNNKPRPFWEDRQVPLVELHDHVGGSLTPAILWSLAHQQGLKLPTKDYWEFVDMITIKDAYTHLNHYEKLYRLPELIQSSPLAIERAVYEIIGGSYRASNVVTHELRYNPMKRNRDGEQDLDHIITASIRGLERALLEYPYKKAGLIVMLDRSFPYEHNEICVNKAIQYSREQSIIGIDMAGPRPKQHHDYAQYKPLINKARQAGLGVTIHVGEEGHSTDELWDVVRQIQPDRIGHGILAATDPKLMEYLAKKNIVLEICPTSNLNTGSIESIDDLRNIIRNLLDHGVKFCINTDGAELNSTTIKKEMRLLYNNQIMSESELATANEIAKTASFIH